MPDVKKYLIAIFLPVLAAIAPSLLALGEPNYVTTTSGANDFPLASPKSSATLFIDDADHWGAKRAASDLQTDIERVTGLKLALVHDAKQLSGEAVILGTLGHSPLVDSLVAEGIIDVSAIAGQWDAYHIELVERPTKGLRRALVIVGSNMRGTIYGAYDLSEKIGVSPWHWWADVPVKTSPQLFVAAGTRLHDAPKVKYRGIFLNDEAPALTGWVHENYGNYTSEFYVHVFELLLRLKSNFLWPAMWNNAFADDDHQNMVLAHQYGIVMSTSHHEPMMRADKEWDRYGEGPWDYARNPDRLHQFWVDGARRNKPYESIYTLGMRGQQDTPMSETEDIDLLERIVADQREILAEVFDDRPLAEVPQVWALYKEVQTYYEKGMRVPDDVILLWCDDNWGNIRRLPTPEERVRPGGAGVYYHFDYVGGPRSYRWINTYQLAKIWEQMNLADAYGANQIWLTNVGDLKPMEFPIEFFLDLAWDIADWPKERIPEYGRLWAARSFGPEHAEEIESLLAGYTRHNGRRKPELQTAATYSLLHYREADRVSAELADLSARAQALYDKLPASHRDAFFQLVLYPVQASATITQMYIAQGRNHLYAAQGRQTANRYADEVRRLFQNNFDLQERFHKEVAGGKWNHMMSQPRIGYVYWNNPAADTLPVTMDYQPHAEAEMGIAVEGMAAAWPAEGNSYQLPTFHNLGQQSYYIEIFNKGTKPFDYKISADHPWVTLVGATGRVEDESRIHVSIDWDKVPVGATNSNLRISGASWGAARIGLKAVKQLGALAGFVEADGYIAIEADAFHRKVDAEGLSWQTIPQLGRTQASVSVFPITDRSFEDPASAPYIEYDITVFTPGPITVEALFAPSLNFVPGRGLRYAIAFDDQPPQIVDILADLSQHAWQESVKDGVRKSRTKHHLDTVGPHTLRIYMVDPAVTLQRLHLDTGALKPTYLGPPPTLPTF